MIPEVIYSQTSIDGDLNFVHNNGVSARRELTVLGCDWLSRQRATVETTDSRI